MNKINLHKNLIKYPKTKKIKKQKKVLKFLNSFNWQYLKNQNYNRYLRVKQTYSIKNSFLQNLLFFYTNYKLKHIYCKKKKTILKNKIKNNLQLFELRLDILISKILNKNIQFVHYYIKTGFISVNNTLKLNNYICQIFDIIKLNYHFKNKKLKLFNVTYLIDKIHTNNNYITPQNYVELDCKTQTFIVLRLPFFYELTNFTFLRKNFVKMLHLQLKLIYNMY